jgi:antitoxin (DNA-binding transcriptional repressor) of toxin-antitoxin stability system
MRVRYTIGLREANHHLAKHIKAVEEGHEVIITRRGRPIARITRETGAGKVRDAKWWAAYERMLHLMADAPRIDGKLHWTRDEIYER